ncbi:hypothetical protein [Photobacterium frigidiphilum]|uniref:hypothetical protein n=1 Tax=Photobacterium frigidiphilum TaxID=264736 RepID=UPI003001FED5
MPSLMRFKLAVDVSFSTTAKATSIAAEGLLEVIMFLSITTGCWVIFTPSLSFESDAFHLTDIQVQT